VLYVFAISMVLIMVGELADKSQLLALVLATRYRAWQVLLGIFVATFIVHFFSTLLGQAMGSLLPEWLLPWLSGLLFVGFGIWTLRGDEIEESDAERGATRFGPVLATAVAFLFAELGDKTQIMTMTIAADPAAVLRTFGSAGPAINAWLGSIGLSAVGITPAQEFWGVWMGSTLGMMIADGIAIIIGAVMGKTLPEKLITRISGTIFILFGVAAIVTAFLK
jgi:putative Ca2+/H+ antiporter (TMEM165/GDT1 family)